ncbi:MAG: single-stranded-DNA-specific exonuclease RecJ [Tissierellia bacterium]|nr:single-stranded-DNA-specific exonuclease RecJ [Tissierellia bacterium]
MSRRFIYNKKSNYKNNIRINGITKLQALILANRDIIDNNTVDMFINPDLSKLHDPFLLNDMDKAIDIIAESMENNEKIRIFGDYDQDGISSVTTLVEGISYFYDNIDYDIPDRVTDGYGVSFNMVKKAKEDGVKLVITCDNGISAFDEIDLLKKEGIKVILTDHHQIKKEEKDGWIDQILPNADAVINPKRLDSTYPFDDLCGAGVSFKLIEALFITLGGEDEYLYSLLEYVAMGTVCDIVSLVDENRIFVKEGLRRINNTSKLGIKALLDANSWNKEVDSYTLGFVIGPCINATGRLSSAKFAVEMLLEDDKDRAYEYARNLVELNKERKILTENGLDTAISIIEENNLSKDDIIVVYCPDIEESICGIVAGRIKEKYQRPAIVLSNSSEENIAKGSGRSIEAYDIYSEIFPYSDNLVSFGGHPMACGLSIEIDKIDDFRKFLNDNSKLQESDFEEIINIDVKLDISKLSLEFAESLSDLRPFGKSNPKPVFADKDISIKSIRMLGKNKDTMKIVFSKNNRDLNSIKFFAKDDYEYIKDNYNKGKRKFDIVYYPDINEYKGVKTLQLRMIDIR